MSQVLIQQYINHLRDLRKVAGTRRESVVREAFKDLLKGWALSRGMTYVGELQKRMEITNHPDQQEQV